MDFPVQFCGISCIWGFQPVLLWFDCLSVPCLPLREGWGKRYERGVTSSLLFIRSLLELPCRQICNFKLFPEAFCLVSSKYREKKRDKEKKRKNNRIGFTLQASSRCLVSPAHSMLFVTVRLSRYCAVHRLAGNNLTCPSFRCSE